MTTILLLKINWLIYVLILHNAHLGISSPHKHHPFLQSLLLNLEAVQALLFYKIPLYIVYFFYEPTPKIRFSSEPP